MKQQLNDAQMDAVSGGVTQNATGTFVLRVSDEDKTPAPEPSIWERFLDLFDFRK